MFPGRRFALALVLAGAVLSCSGAVAVADPNQLVQAEIWPAGGGPATNESVSIGGLESRSGQCPTYEPGGPNIGLYGAGGIPTNQDQVTAQSWTIPTVLSCLSPPVPPRNVLDVQVERSDGTLEQPLSPADLGYSPPGSASDFYVAQEFPLIYVSGNQIYYDRPWRGGTDDNAADRVFEQSPSSFALQVFEEHVGNATVTASPNPATVNASVSFSASASGPGGPLTYAWNFDGGLADSDTSSAPSVTFASGGTYDVTVEITGTSGPPAEGSVTLQVGPQTTTTTQTNPNAPPTGPTNGSGNTPGGSAGKPSTHGNGTSGKHPSGQKPGATKGKHQPKPNTKTTTSGSGGTANGSGASGSGSSSGGKNAGASHGRGQSRHSGGGQATPAKRRPASTSGPATVITGRLVSDVTPLPAGASPLVHVEPGPLPAAPAARRPIAASVLPALAAALAVALLFSLGAGRELRWRHPLRLLRFSS